MTIIEAENNSVSRGFFPVMPALNAGGAYHAHTVPRVSIIARRPFPA
jgi:hypothetical protein